MPAGAVALAQAWACERDSPLSPESDVRIEQSLTQTAATMTNR